MKTWISTFLLILLCLLLPLSLTLGNAMLLCYSPSTYQKLLFENNEISLSRTDRKILADSFYQGLTRRKSVQVKLSNGKIAFSEKEITHMLDVSKLIRFLLILTILLLLISGFLLSWLFKLKNRLFPYLPLLSLLLSLLLLMIVLLNFSSSFTLFHQISFRNDFWLLDPAKDLLINLFPYSFFVTEFAKIGVMTILELVLLFFGLRVLKK